MNNILLVQASARKTRSITRHLAKTFEDAFLVANPKTQIVTRDLLDYPPQFVTEEWIAAAFSRTSDKLDDDQRAVLAASDELIAELDSAEIIVLGTPMYNYGMPAALKAWFDNVIRIDKTFSFDLKRGDYPLEPIMAGKTLVILSSRGEFGFGPGGVREDMNHLETHIRTCARYLGVEQSHLIAIDYQEFGDERHERSIEEAYAAVPQLVELLQSRE